MHEKRVDLQSAIDRLAEMLAQRVADYTYLKTQVPSFGPEVDSELQRYFQALEHYLRGNVEWCYLSRRKEPLLFHFHYSDQLTSCYSGYFRGLDVSNKKDLIVPLFRKGNE